MHRKEIGKKDHQIRFTIKRRMQCPNYVLYWRLSISHYCCYIIMHLVPSCNTHAKGNCNWSDRTHATINRTQHRIRTDYLHSINVRRVNHKRPASVCVYVILFIILRSVHSIAVSITFHECKTSCTYRYCYFILFALNAQCNVCKLVETNLYSIIWDFSVILFHLYFIPFICIQ